MRQAGFFTLTLTLGMLLGVPLSACSDSNANSSAGISEERVKELIAEAVAPYEERIAALENDSGSGLAERVARLENATTFVVASGTGTAVGLQKATATTASGSAVTDFCKKLNSDGNGTPWNSKYLDCLSTDGLLFSMDRVTGAIREISTVLFETNDCTGTAYANAGHFTLKDNALPQGALFRYGNAHAPSNLGHVLAGASPTPIQAASEFNRGRGCEPFGGVTLDREGFAVQDYEGDAVPADGANGPILYE